MKRGDLHSSRDDDYASQAGTRAIARSEPGSAFNSALLAKTLKNFFFFFALVVSLLFAADISAQNLNCPNVTDDNPDCFKPGRSNSRVRADGDGDAKYYNQEGRQAGRSRTSPNGQTRYYDGAGRPVGSSRPDRSGNVNYYDSAGKKQGRSRTNSRGETVYYDHLGRRTKTCRTSSSGHVSCR
ncbi:MAG: hypothetical protein LBJ64_02925 [Deltaproteobacteria bacterium]|jgi:hypothetical protein|nr:hypothetical protein [Deltaproteobacteria bacterium]